MSDWEDKQYFWVVICKNRRFHQNESIWSGHKIYLGETDAYSPLPVTQKSILIGCEACGKEYEYNQKEILRFESEPMAQFVGHPLFRGALEI